MAKCVLVTGIGGNVGQGILRNILVLKWDIRLIGTNTEAVSAGNHLCDKTYKVPFGNSKAYIPKMATICRSEEVDLIIPSTGYESYSLSRSGKRLPTVATSDREAHEVFLDKYRTSLEFQKFQIPFAKTSLPKDFRGRHFSEIIVKPREGRGSRDVHVKPAHPQRFSSEYIVQEYLSGAEITSAFYVTRQRKVLGPITFKRELAYGATAKCSVYFGHQRQVRNLIEKIVRNFPIYGSCNVQAIVSGHQVIPFEVNCRISGTNSIRAHFGFPDVEFTLREYLFGQKLTHQPRIKKGAAVRLLTDVIYPGISISGVKDRHTRHYQF